MASEMEKCRKTSKALQDKAFRADIFLLVAEKRRPMNAHIHRIIRSLPTAPSVALWCWAVNRTAEGWTADRVLAVACVRVQTWWRCEEAWRDAPPAEQERLGNEVLAGWAADAEPEHMAARIAARTAVFRMSDRQLGAALSALYRQRKSESFVRRTDATSTSA